MNCRVRSALIRGIYIGFMVQRENICRFCQLVAFIVYDNIKLFAFT